MEAPLPDGDEYLPPDPDSIGKSVWAEGIEAANAQLAEREARRQADEQAREEEAAKKRNPMNSKPWNGSDKRWRKDHLALKKKRPGWRPRFVREDQVEAKMSEGWSVANARHYGGGVKVPGLHKGNDVAETIIRRGTMILMEIPEQHAQERDAYYAAKNAAQTSDPTDDAIRSGNYRRDGHFGAPRRRPKAPVKRDGPVGSFW